MAIQNNFLRTIQQWYQSYSSELCASKRIEKIQDDLDQHPIFLHGIDTYQEKIYICLYLRKLLQQESLFCVAHRFSLLRNSSAVLLSKKRISSCFVSYLDEICNTLEMLIRYHCSFKLSSLLSFENLDSFSNLFEVEEYLFDISVIPYDILLGVSIYHNCFYRSLANSNSFQLYDFMNRFSFEEREQMEKKLKQFHLEKYNSRKKMIKQMLVDMPPRTGYQKEIILQLQQMNDQLFKKGTKRRIRNCPNSSYDYVKSLF